MQYVVDDSVVESVFHKMWNEVSFQHERNGVEIDKSVVRVDGYELECKTIKCDGWEVEWTESLNVYGTFDVFILKNISREEFISQAGKFA